MQSASDTPSSHLRRAVAKPDGAVRRSSWRSRRPEQGVPGPNQVVAKERVRAAAGAPARNHERHATRRTFATYFAPADFNETVNTLGQPLYAKQEPRRFDRGTDLHTQSNPLPLCHRPALLVKLVMA